jgi:hypothetical protein
MLIYCCACKREVKARLTNGSEIYRARKDLHSLPFWKCDRCKNYVGCHHKTANRTKPLGNIPTKELRNARQHIHAILDPLWRCKCQCNRREEIYKELSNKLGYDYHTAEIKDIEEARKVWHLIKEMEGKTK